jgi:hypothetical protein
LIYDIIQSQPTTSKFKPYSQLSSVYGQWCTINFTALEKDLPVLKAKAKKQKKKKKKKV